MKKLIVIAMLVLSIFVLGTTFYFAQKTVKLVKEKDNLANKDLDDENVDNEEEVNEIEEYSNNEKNAINENEDSNNEKNAIDENEDSNSEKNIIDENEDTNNEDNNEVIIKDENDVEENVCIEVDEETLRELRVNEVGKIYVLMFHGFIQEKDKDTYNDKQYTMTLNQFRETLEILYEKDYYPISMKDMLEGYFDVPLGKTPVVLTFDDARSGQFCFVEENGDLVIDKNTAVYVWQQFSKTHPDFPMDGTFYVNLGLPTFGNVGTLKEKLSYMIDQGFEIGNHSYTHDYLRKMTDVDQVVYELGMNQKVMEETILGYKFSSLALPFGEDVSIEALRDAVVSGNYEGTEYNHLGILDCKWCPSPSVYSKSFNARSIYRVRADGLEPVDCDMSDWFDTKLKTKRGQFISDGCADTITVPDMVEDDFDKIAFGDKKIKIYHLD